LDLLYNLLLPGKLAGLGLALLAFAAAARRVAGFIPAGGGQQDHGQQ
jgi:hypothetical protein